MNFEQEQLAHDEIEINISLILKKCIQNIKWIIICAVVSAVAISSLMYLKDVRDFEQANRVSVVEALTEEEEEAVNRYYLLNTKLEQLQVYKDESPIMQMDCNDVYQYTINYYISGDEKEDVAVAIERYISSKLFANEFSKNIDSIDEIYVGELVACLTTEVESGVISIKVLAASEKEIQYYVDVVKSVVLSYSDKMQEDIGYHELEILYEEMTHGYSEQVYSVQNGYYSNISSVETALSNYFETLSIKEKNYITKDASEAIENMMPKPTIQIKYMLIGMCIGVILCVLAIVILSLLDGKLHSKKEIMKRFQIAHYGIVDRNVTREQMEMMTSRVSKSCENIDVRRIAIISTLDSLAEESIDMFVSELEKKNIRCNVLGNVLEDKKAVEGMSNTTPVILIEKIEETKVKELYDEIVFCNNMEIKIMGYICLN